MTAENYTRPLPIKQPEWDFYWEKTQAHELWIMHCQACNEAYFYPRAICPNCLSRDTRWIKSSGKGTVFAFAIIHRPPMPSFADMVPFVTAFILLEEGARIPSNLVDVEPDPSAVKVGMPVEVVFDDVTPEFTLPKFRPAS